MLNSDIKKGFWLGLGAATALVVVSFALGVFRRA